MSRAVIELYLAQIFGKVFGFLPFGIGSVKAAAVHPDPTVRANPFGSTSNVGMSARNRHRDILGILQFDSIFRAGVPDRVGGRENSLAFDLGRAGTITIHAPVSDIAMVPDPIEQLSAAGVVIPA